MLISDLTTAPAGLFGWGACVVPPSLLAAAPGARGTRLPSAGMAPRIGGHVARRDRRVDVRTPNFELTQNDGTTLGSHIPRRPI